MKLVTAVVAEGVGVVGVQQVGPCYFVYRLNLVMVDMRAFSADSKETGNTTCNYETVASRMNSKAVSACWVRNPG